VLEILKAVEDMQRLTAKINAFDNALHARACLEQTRATIGGLNRELEARESQIDLLNLAIELQESNGRRNGSDIIARLRASDALLEFNKVVQILHCHPQTLYQYVRERKIKSRRVGSRIKFDPRAVIDFLEGRPVN
jgi:hypothetical protein